MSTSVFRSARWALVTRTFAFAAVAVLGIHAWAEDGVKIVKVEEDWELVVLTPDSGTTAPQVTCTMSPFADDDSLHMTFELNHKSGAQFVAGGLTMQTWNGGSWLTTRRHDSSASMGSSGEKVTWTQQMKLNGDVVEFQIKNGSSTTWGSFGSDEKIKSTASWHLDDLNQYSPTTSVAHSGVGYASNRVQSLTLKKVRVYTASGDFVEDSTPRVVYQHE